MLRVAAQFQVAPIDELFVNSLTCGVPTLVLHRKEHALAPVECGRDLARRIPEVQYIGRPGTDPVFWPGDSESLIGDIAEFVTLRVNHCRCLQKRWWNCGAGTGIVSDDWTLLSA